MEYKFLFLTQATIIIPLGLIAPANKPNWWNLNTWSYAFFWNSASFNSLTGTSLNPYGNTSYVPLINNSFMVSANSQTGNTDILTGVVLVNNSGKGIAGKTSDDVGSACINGSTRYNTIPSDVVNQNFLIINPVAGGLVIKVQS